MNNKRYIDFVPAKAKKEEAPKAKAAKAATLKVVAPKAKVVAKEPVKRQVTARREDARLGVIEDLNTGRAETSVSRSHFNEEKDEIRAAKAKKVGTRETALEKPSGLSTRAKSDETFKPPKSPFINQDKVVKRPLSKNVYQKKVEVPKEEPKGPVTIITKPEKQAHVSLIVTIILTIILGAAAGTVAFLLLPK